MKQKLLVFLISILSTSVFGQIRQTVRGDVKDIETKTPLIGAVVTLYKDSLLLNGATTDANGKFLIAEIPVGRIRLVCRYIGYNDFVLDNLEVGSAKELVLNIELEESAIEIQTVEINATREGETLNEMATVSARQFSVEETDRYAGSRGDPARMASNFAGVQGADDSRNDIVVRGNSPQGILWRMEGIDIPNPNHFNIPGTAGGPVSIINNKYLANSDFFTGAFPADYGNSIAGVFDLRMRNGNNQQHEFSGQFGFLGTEIFAEGPLNKAKGSSYLVSYRYSTIELFSKMGIDIGTDAVPRYQDGAFRFFFPMKNNASLALWGVGGKSSIDILISDQTSPDQRNIYGDNDRDQYFKTRMGTVGATYSKTLGEKTYLKSTVAVMNEQVDSYHELVFRHLNTDNQYVVDSLAPLLDYNFNQSRITNGTSITYKINRKLTWKSGINADLYLWSHQDSVLVVDSSSVKFNQWNTRWNSEDQGVFIQPYTQVKWRPSEKWTITLGVHESIFMLSGNDTEASNQHITAPEPRLGARYQLNHNQHLSFGLGRHSQLQPAYMYFYQTTDAQGNYIQNNRNMGFTKSDHVVASYQIIVANQLRIMTEVYYQRLFDVPVESNVSSSFSMVNTGAGFSRIFPGSLTNKGRAQNYGFELTIEKFFSKNWLFLFTASAFESKYQGSDGVWRNTDFNGKYAMNALASKEWVIKDRNRFTLGTKLTTAGGRWYGPADIVASNAARELVFVDSLRNTRQFNPYFRWDIKTSYKINRAKVAHTIGLDLVNVVNTKNVLKLTYAPDENNNPNTAVREEYQLGFLPVFFYKIDF